MEYLIKSLEGPDDHRAAMRLYEQTIPWATTTMVEKVPGSLWQQAFDSPNSMWWIVGRGIALIGFEEINSIDGVASPIISVDEACQKQGHGRKLAEVMRDIAFNTLNIRRIQSSLLADAPSIKLLEHLGFEKEGTSRAVRYRNGEYVDVVHYALIRS